MNAQSPLAYVSPMAAAAEMRRKISDVSELSEMIGSKPREATASSTAITINLITMGLGTGLLTMPWGVAGASIVTSCLLLAVILGLNYWTIMLLVRAADQLQEFDLGAMLSKLPQPMGRWLQQLGNGIILSSQFLVLLGYTIVVVDTVRQLSPEGSLIGQRPAAALLMALVVLPLSFLDQRYLAFTSTLSILANTYLIGLLVFYSVVPGHLSTLAAAEEGAGEELCIWGMTKGSVTMFSLLMYTIIIQMVIPPMYQELEGRTPEKFSSCLLVAFACLFVIFSAVMICGYIVFGPSVASSVLDNLPHDTWGSLARLGMSLCVIGCYPLNVKPMAAPFARSAPSTAGTEPLLNSDTAGTPAPQRPLACSGSTVATITIVASVSTMSLWIKSLGPLNAINGAIQVIGYIGLIPGVIGLYLVKGVGSGQRVALMVLMVFATVSSALGFIVTDNNAPALTTSCQVPWLRQ
mmetsp:Transcript_63555/g.185822  ORF Transcript_63555/g.185822 Transcript_63555/m.185822 type:complete len:465 (-) Transcript_63555:51-1445(-)